MAEVEQSHGHRGEEFELLLWKSWEINSDEDVPKVFQKWRNAVFQWSNSEKWKTSKKKTDGELWIHNWEERENKIKW